MKRPPLLFPGRHFQLLALANSIPIEKPTMGLPGERQQMLLINFAHRPLKKCLQMDRNLEAINFHIYQYLFGKIGLANSFIQKMVKETVT